MRSQNSIKLKFGFIFLFKGRSLIHNHNPFSATILLYDYMIDHICFGCSKIIKSLKLSFLITKEGLVYY